MPALGFSKLLQGLQASMAQFACALQQPTEREDQLHSLATEEARRANDWVSLLAGRSSLGSVLWSCLACRWWGLQRVGEERQVMLRCSKQVCGYSLPNKRGDFNG